MDPNKRSWKEDTGNRDEMLSQTPWHLLQRPHHQWRGDQPHPWNNRAVWRPPGNSEEKKTEILRSHHKIIRTLQNYTARHCTREKSKRKTKEKMGGQHTWMDGYGAGKDNKRGWGQRGMEENDCKIFCGAPTVTPTAGYVSNVSGPSGELPYSGERSYGLWSWWALIGLYFYPVGKCVSNGELS